mmetsp:Transcript_18436/g.22574  ORF Transcript_18436/g.22574 Transcript_18436/m.22574 type:complete len:729 (-) Transcript_18436:176-2362(-)
MKNTRPMKKPRPSTNCSKMNTGTSDSSNKQMDPNTKNTKLLQLMGLSLNKDPSSAPADWQAVEQHLRFNSEEAKEAQTLSYPLNLALANSERPCPVHIIASLCKAYPEAITEETFGNCCRYPHTTSETMQTLIKHNPALKKPEAIKRWDLDFLATNNNRDVALVLVKSCAADLVSSSCGANPRTLDNWEEFRFDTHAFWLQVLLDADRWEVSLEHVKEIRLLRYFMLEGNVDAVEILLNAYPSLIQHCDPKTRQLPIHIALRSRNTAYSPWNNRSSIVKLLLDFGIKHQVGGKSGCGGLYVCDRPTSSTAMSRALEVLTENSQWRDEERYLCLKICLQYAHAFMFHDYDNGSTSFLSKLDPDMPILHAAIGVLKTDDIKTIIDQFHVQEVTQLDSKGRNALFSLIELFTERRPCNGITICKHLTSLQQSERELLRRFELEHAHRGNLLDAVDGNMPPFPPNHVAGLDDAFDPIIGFRDPIARMIHGAHHNDDSDSDDDDLPRMRDRNRRRAQRLRDVLRAQELPHGEVPRVEVRLARRHEMIARRLRLGRVHEFELFRQEHELRRHHELDLLRRREDQLRNPEGAQQQQQQQQPQQQHRQQPANQENRPNRRHKAEDEASQLRETEIRYMKNVLDILLNYNATSENCAQMKDRYGSLPLHFAVERAMTMEQGLEDIIKANRDAVTLPDGCTGIYPFALARNNLDVSFELLRDNPGVMGNILQDMNMMR